jgi:hypothetical protein
VKHGKIKYVDGEAVKHGKIKYVDGEAVKHGKHLLGHKDGEAEEAGKVRVEGVGESV